MGYRQYRQANVRSVLRFLIVRNFKIEWLSYIISAHFKFSASFCSEGNLAQVSNSLIIKIINLDINLFLVFGRLFFVLISYFLLIVYGL